MWNLKRLLVVFCLVLGVSGCVASPRVADNTYDPAGGQAMQVSSMFEYVGSPRLKERSTCVGAGCTPYKTPGDKVLSDVFVSELDGVAEEFVIFHQVQPPNGYYWPALSGKKVEFGGKEYVERFSEFYTDEPADPYVTYLREMGYRVDPLGFQVRMLVRNVNDTKRLYVMYGYSLDLMSHQLRNDYDAQEDFLTKGFLRHIRVPES